MQFTKEEAPTMKKLTLAALALITLTASGCATQKSWTPISGSKSDGVVRLAYEYGAFEKPMLTYGQDTQLASQRCKAWGYTGSESFGSSLQDCLAYNQYGCVKWRVTAEHQCTGKTL